LEKGLTFAELCDIIDIEIEREAKIICVLLHLVNIATKNSFWVLVLSITYPKNTTWKQQRMTKGIYGKRD
jgi:hypothetical protein